MKISRRFRGQFSADMFIDETFAMYTIKVHLMAPYLSFNFTVGTGSPTATFIVWVWLFSNVDEITLNDWSMVVDNYLEKNKKTWLVKLSIQKAAEWSALFRFYWFFNQQSTKKERWKNTHPNQRWLNDESDEQNPSPSHRNSKPRMPTIRYCMTPKKKLPRKLRAI
jgi:hypothetical protein